MEPLLQMEPYFSNAYYYRAIFDNTVRLTWVNPLLMKALERYGLDGNKEIMDTIIGSGSVQDINMIPKCIKDAFITAMDITPEEHVLMQAACQAGIGTSVSKTINFPQNATLEDISKGFYDAWRYMCKGVTVYRDKCRDLQVLNLATNDCPDCKTPLEKKEGCWSCKACGFSMCSR